MFASCTLTCLAALTCFGARAHAVRDDDTALALTSGAVWTGARAAKREGEMTPVMQCVLHSGITLTCPSGKGVGILSAMWSRRKLEGCTPEQKPPEGAGVGCRPKFTDRAAELCRQQGGESCTLPVGADGCAENPFTQMRVRWSCSGPAGPEPTQGVVRKPDSAAPGAGAGQTRVSPCFAELLVLAGLRADGALTPEDWHRCFRRMDTGTEYPDWQLTTEEFRRGLPNCHFGAFSGGSDRMDIYAWQEVLHKSDANFDHRLHLRELVQAGFDTGIIKK